MKRNLVDSRRVRGNAPLLDGTRAGTCRRSARVALLAFALAMGLSGCKALPGWMVLQGKSAITDHRHFDNAPIAKADRPSPLPAASAALQWPDGAQTADVERLLAENGSVAFIVLQRGAVVYERYFNGYSRDSVTTSFSMAKSVVSALVGIAIDEGRIAGVDDPVTRYLPELRRNDPRFDRITLRHLLTMRSGIAFDESYRSPLSEAARFYLGPDLRAEVAKLRIEGEPDQRYRYQSGDTQLLAMAVERATGAPIARYLETRVWQPMGAEFDASWSLDSAAGGVARGFCCLNARAIDYARFGQVFLNAGQANGRQIVPAAWVAHSTAAQSLTGADDAARRNIERPGSPNAVFYAWQWRRMPTDTATFAAAAMQPGTDFYAQGLYGQVLYIAPGSQTVVLRLGSTWGDVNWPRWMGRLSRLNP
jgi:CubicO group peptidase (beta-lactamase class C family)